MDINAYLRDLHELVAIDSGGRNKAGIDAVNDWLEARMHRLGMTVERDSQTEIGDNLIGRIKGTGGINILLLGHTDIVFPYGTVATRPIRTEGKRLIGPGTCDMKAGLLSGLYAIEAIRDHGFEAFGSIVFLCVSDEESQPRYSLDLMRQVAQTVDVGFTLEAARANGDIVVARKGMRWYQIQAFGKPAHAGVEPEKGVNAILGLVEKIAAFQALNGHQPDATVNVGVIHGGSAPNVVPDHASVILDVRAYSDADLDATEAAIQEIVATTANDVTFKMLSQHDAFSPAMPITDDVQALATSAKAIATEMGITLEGAKTGGISDANIIAAEGVPILDGLGPVGGLDHSPDEYIEIDSILPRIDLLSHLIMQTAHID